MARDRATSAHKPRGVPRVDDRQVLNGIFWVLRSAAPWRYLPERYGPRTTCYNHFVRWRRARVWNRLMDALTAAYDGDIQMIDSELSKPRNKLIGSAIGTFETCPPIQRMSVHRVDRKSP